MVSKAQIKLIKSLAQKKYRDKYGLFVVEGLKGIEEFLKSEVQLNHVYTTELCFDLPENKCSIISENDLKRISQLKSPNTAVAIFKVLNPKPIDQTKLILALDDVRDPGNLGTIIRLCDWFGVKDLVCSNKTVDCYNPKVVQATMGSLARVNINYLDLEDYINDSELEVYGTFMNGDNIYKTSLPKKGIVVMGNEANGVSNEVERLIDKRLTIPQFGDLKETESLNVATATAICISEFKRNLI